MKWAAQALASLLVLVSAAPVRSARAADPKRPHVDYDGRPQPASEAALWAPRVLLFPPWLVSEYVVRKPIGALVRAKPEGGDDADAGPRFAPSVLVDLGFRPWVGVYSSWDPAWGKAHRLLGYVAFGGLGAMTEAFADRIATRYGTLTLREDWTRRDDALFNGFGPTTPRRDARRYGFDRIDAGPSFDMPLGRTHLHALASGGVRAVRFDEAGCCEGQPALPRFAGSGLESYTLLYERAVLALDTRPSIPGRSFGDPPRRSGVRAALEGEANFDVARRGRSWARYGAVVAGYWDLHDQRVVSLTLNALFVDPLSGTGADVPFTEQPSLGGDAPLQGFRPGRLTGRSATAATLAYEWPIWTWLSAVIDASVGNVFGARLRGFDPELLRFASTVGVHVLDSNAHYFQIVTGFGTEPLANGFKADSFRLTFGMTRRF